MRRHSLLAVASIGVLFLAGCASGGDTPRRTVTAVVTVSSTPGSDAAASDTAASGSATDSAATDSAAPGTDASGSAGGSPATSASVSAEPFVTVDPLAADCGALMNAEDVKRTLNADIPVDRLKVSVAEVNTQVGQVGRTRCLFGLTADRKSGAVTVAFTTYADAAAAQKQVGVTVQAEADAGATIVETTVRGYPATVALRDGGLIIMAYDTWTMAIAASTERIDQAAMEAGLPQLAEAVLARVIKT